MSASTKGLLGDKDKKPAPQYFNPVTNDYEYLLGSGGAARHILYDEDGNPVDLEGILEVLGLDLTSLEGKDFATETTLNSFLALIGEVQAIPTANTLLARLKSLEDKIDAITAGTTPVVSQLSGSNVEISGVSFVVSGGDTIRNTAANKPNADAAHAAIPFCYYHAIDTGTVEATDGTNWVVI